MKPAYIEVNVTITMSLAEALELEKRLSGGEETETTKALARAINIQMDAAYQAIEAAA